MGDSQRGEGDLPWAKDHLTDPELLQDSLERREACEGLGLVREGLQEAGLQKARA